MDHDVYNGDFYQWQSSGSFRSASRVVPALTELFSPKSVLDVGCGVGTWLRAFAEVGVADVHGVDGEWVQGQVHQVAEGRIQVADLSRPLDFGRRFDLVTSFEVAEHLPEDAADAFVASLVRHGDVIAFSAAAPFQGGDNHLNERWPEYWAAKFRAMGYQCYDILRPRFWDDEAVEWWYRQNIFVAVKTGFIGAEKLGPPCEHMRPMVYPGRYELLASKYYALQSSFGLDGQSVTPISPMHLMPGLARILRSGSACIICGAGDVGRMAGRILSLCGIQVLAYSDKKLGNQGRQIDGVPVLDIHGALARNPQAVVIGTLGHVQAIEADVLSVCTQRGGPMPDIVKLA